MNNQVFTRKEQKIEEGTMVEMKLNSTHRRADLSEPTLPFACVQGVHAAHLPSIALDYSLAVSLGMNTNGHRLYLVTVHHDLHYAKRTPYYLEKFCGRVRVHHWDLGEVREIFNAPYKLMLRGTTWVGSSADCFDTLVFKTLREKHHDELKALLKEVASNGNERDEGPRKAFEKRVWGVT